jgi:hypothetical protein
LAPVKVIIGIAAPTHTDVVPVIVADGIGFTVIVARLVSLIHGAVPVIVYVNVEVVVPIAEVKVPAAALKVPPAPVVLVQTPPACSPEIKENKLIGVRLFSQIVVAPSVPAVGCGFMVIVATLESFIHGSIPVTVYVNVDVVAPTEGIYVPATASKVPPVPVDLTQVPPGCSPVIKLNKSTAVVLVSQTTVLPSTPAFG